MKTFKEYLLEVKLAKTIDGHMYWLNPRFNELENILRRSTFKELKYILDGKDFVVFDGSDVGYHHVFLASYQHEKQAKAQNLGQLKDYGYITAYKGEGEYNLLEITGEGFDINQFLEVVLKYPKTEHMQEKGKKGKWWAIPTKV